MERTVLSTYTDRQLAILRGEVKPENNDEWVFLQDHSSDILPKSKPKVPAQKFKFKLPDVEMPLGSCPDD